MAGVKKNLSDDRLNNFNELTWDSAKKYLSSNHAIPIPMCGSMNCILIIESDQNIELQLRTKEAAETNLKFLPCLKKLEFRAKATQNYEFLSISCKPINFNETVLKFFNTVATFFVLEKEKASQAINKAYDRWVHLLQTVSSIDPIVLQGLWGELWVIKSVFENHSAQNAEALLNNWTGPLGFPNDFSFGDTVVDVKTTKTTGNHIKISSWNQLDAAFAWLIIIKVFHCPRSEGGKSLLDLTNEIKEYANLECQKKLLDSIFKIVGTHDLSDFSNTCLNIDAEPKIIYVDKNFPAITFSKLENFFSDSQMKRLIEVQYVVNCNGLEDPNHTNINTLFQTIFSKEK